MLYDWFSRFASNSSLDACSNGKMLMACSNAESGETEGTAKKEKGLEKKLLATKA